MNTKDEKLKIDIAAFSRELTNLSRKYKLYIANEEIILVDMAANEKATITFDYMQDVYTQNISVRDRGTLKRIK